MYQNTPNSNGTIQDLKALEMKGMNYGCHIFTLSDADSPCLWVGKISKDTEPFPRLVKLFFNCTLFLVLRLECTLKVTQKKRRISISAKNPTISVLLPLNQCKYL